MRTLLTYIALLAVTIVNAQTGDEILKQVDINMTSKNSISEYSMIIKGKRGSRTMISKNYTIGVEKSFTEYLSPAREAGTKMLKLDDKLWIYSPTTDRTIQISGHMLRQSVMGSDLSYEDMMDDRTLSEIYNTKLTGKETIDGRECYVIELTAKVDDIPYETQKIWVDVEYMVPLAQEQYAKSGQLLKKVKLSDIKRIGDKWYPMLIWYKDMLKQGEGSSIVVNSIAFDQEIPDYIFTKAALKQ